MCSSFACLLLQPSSALINYNSLKANGYFNRDSTYVIAIVSYQVIMILFETVMFVSIYWNLATKHHYEFQRNKQSMRFQYALALLYHPSVLAQGIVIFYANNYYISEKAAEYLRWTVVVFRCLPPVLFCLKFLTLVRIKSHIDVLQGITKLDHLVKVSVFQIFKDKRIQQQKEHIGNSIDRLSSFFSDTSTTDSRTSEDFILPEEIETSLQQESEV